MAGRAFVLHLTRATMRRDTARLVLAVCGLEGEIWPAVDGAAMSSRDLAGCVGARLFAPAYPFALGAGEIGCFLSHRQVWAEIVRCDLDFGLILPDDAVIEPAAYAAALHLAMTHIDRLGYIGFQAGADTGPGMLVDTVGSCVLRVPQDSGPGITAQMVSWDAADHLLRLTESFDRPVDSFVRCHWHTGLRPATIHPCGISAPASPPPDAARMRPVLDRLRQGWAGARYRRDMARAARQSAAPVQGGLG